jgi:hypothetical protein
MFGTDSILDQFAALAALMAAGIAVGGFLGHAGPALRGERDDKLRWATAVGGLAGFGLVTLLVVVLSAISAILAS